MIAVSLLAVARPKGNNGDDGMRKGKGKVYVFALSQQLTDTLAFITDIQEVDSIDLEKKTKFLPYRSEFSLQFKEYLEGTEKQFRQTACVFFSDNRNKLAKKYAKVKKRYLSNKDIDLIEVDRKKFTFKHPLDSFVQHEENK